MQIVDFTSLFKKFQHHVRDDSLYICGDSRELLLKLKSDSVDCIITSPPYLDVKDYGGDKQVGHGQTNEEYFSDMAKVFEELYRVSKNSTPFWLIVDNVKQSDGLVLLPFRLASIAEKCGWKVHDLIVWDKGKSLPWSRNGKLRGVCEYIVLLGKGNLEVFNIDAIRDTSDISQYWIKYPERYNPSGKAPGNLWHFPIPIQGSWSSGDIRHDCPIPIELITRMILLSTHEEAIVLDPFAGSASVAQASAQNSRRSISFDSNELHLKSFIKMKEISDSPRIRVKEDIFAETIMSLRKNKMAIQIFKSLSRPDNLNGTVSKNTKGIYVSDVADNFIQIHYLMEKGSNIKVITSLGREILGKAPLSKYGVKVEFYAIESVDEFADLVEKNEIVYEYTAGKFYSTPTKHHKIKLTSYLRDIKSSKYPPLFSDFSVQIDFVE